MDAFSAAELMAQYCAGNAQAFHLLYARLAPRVHGYLLRLCNDQRDRADDLLQQTFLKIHHARGAYIWGADPLPWFYSIAHRTFLDDVRKRKTLARHFVNEGASQEASRAIENRIDESPTSEAEQHTIDQVHAMTALEHLPESQRIAVVLTRLEGHSIAEVAKRTGSTEGAIKQRIHRGYETLRKLVTMKKTEFSDE